jgi:hypothetical protein
MSERLQIIIVLALPVVLSAQAPAPAPSGEIAVAGSIRTRLEAWNWFDTDANDAYAFSGNLLRLSFARQGERWDWQVEFAAPLLLGLPDDSVAPGAQGLLGLGANYLVANDRSNHAVSVFPKQAFLRLKHGKHSLRFGRFEFNDGAEISPPDPTLAALKRDRISQRLIGAFGWTHVGRSFDGIHYAWGDARRNLTIMSALPTRGVFQVDGWGNLEVNVTYAAATLLTGGKTQSGDFRVFGIYYTDWRDVVKTDARPQGLRMQDRESIKIGSFGGHWLHRFSTEAGTFDTLLWGVAQVGKWGNLDHGATAIAAEAGWQPAGLTSLRPWLRVGYFRGSGDDDPNDEEHGSFFQILPTPRPYARMPFFDFINNQDLMAELILRPHRQLTARFDVHALRLTERNDLWYLGGGAFQPWSFGYVGRPSNGHRSLATLYDFSADYNVSTSLTLSGYLAHARGHSVVRSIYPQGRIGTFGYLEMTYRF